MSIDWMLVGKIAGPVGLVLLGKYLDRWLAQRPKLVSYLGHASAFTVKPQGTGTGGTIHTHAIVVLNAGRSSANNIRIGHHLLPEQYQLNPAVPHTLEGKVGGPAEIVIPKLVPGEQVTISYLYFPPLLWSQIHDYAKSDEGFAKILNVLPTPQLSRWLQVAIWALVGLGGMTLAYLLTSGVLWLAS